MNLKRSWSNTENSPNNTAAIINNIKSEEIDLSLDGIKWCSNWYKDKTELMVYFERYGEVFCAKQLAKVLNSKAIFKDKSIWARKRDLVDVMNQVLHYQLEPGRDLTIVIRKIKEVLYLKAELTYVGLITLANRAKPEMELSAIMWTVANHINFTRKHNRIPNGIDDKDTLLNSDEEIKNYINNLFELPHKTKGSLDSENNLASVQVLWTNRNTGMKMGQMFSIGELRERMSNVDACQRNINVWATDPNAMWVKTAIKQYLKLKSVDLGIPFDMLHTPDERVDTEV